MQRDLSEPAKDNIRSRIASTIQSTSMPDSNLTKDEQQAPRRLKNDQNIVILPADKGRVTVVMDKTDCHDKMDALVNDKQTYEELRRDPTPAPQHRLNSKLLTLKKTDTLTTRSLTHYESCFCLFIFGIFFLRVELLIFVTYFSAIERGGKDENCGKDENTIPTPS